MNRFTSAKGDAAGWLQRAPLQPRSLRAHNVFVKHHTFCAWVQADSFYVRHFLRHFLRRFAARAHAHAQWRLSDSGAKRLCDGHVLRRAFRVLRTAHTRLLVRRRLVGLALGPPPAPPPRRIPQLAIA